MWKRRAQHCLTLLALTTLAALSNGAAQATATAPPHNLNVPPGHVQLFEMTATGVQTYACRARPDDPDTYTWAFIAPEADLWSRDGTTAGTHYAGPTWMSTDGSTVVGAVMDRADAATPEAIPWLLLKAASHEGTGVFDRVTYIQRIDTVGGVSPVGGCDQEAAGREASVAYQATYAFYSFHAGDAQ